MSILKSKGIKSGGITKVSAKGIKIRKGLMLPAESLLTD